MSATAEQIEALLKELNNSKFIEVSVIDPSAAGPVFTNAAFFMANRRYRVVAARYSHRVKGIDSSPVTAMIKKASDGQSNAQGVDLLTGTGFNCKGNDNEAQNGTLVTSPTDLTLAVGDRLAFVYSGNLTSLVGVCATVTLERL